MKGYDGRVYTPFSVRLYVGKRAAESGYESGAIEMIERDPLPEHGSPTHWYVDVESARMLASQLTAAVSRLSKRKNTQSGHRDP